MATTTPDNIWTPDAGDNYALTTDLAAMADTIQDAITDVRSTGAYRADLEANRLSTPDPFDGLLYFSTDTGKLWRYSAGTWLPVTGGLVLLQTITFTAASSVSFTGFTPQFDNYRALLDIHTSSGSAGATIRLRAGGVDNSAAQYATQQDWAQSTGQSSQLSVSQTSIPFTPVAGSEHSATLEFFAPALARVSRVNGEVGTWISPTSGLTSTFKGRHNVASSFDGFTYLPSGGVTITGSLSVYGYVK